MLDVLKKELARAERLKKKVVKPHNIRIKKLRAAIRNIEDFNDASSEVTKNQVSEVYSVPK